MASVKQILPQCRRILTCVKPNTYFIRIWSCFHFTNHKSSKLFILFCYIFDFGTLHKQLNLSAKMERNYAEDQANEVEALESIYCDDIEGKEHIRWVQPLKTFFCARIRVWYWKCSLEKWFHLIKFQLLFVAVLSTGPHKFGIQISTEEYDAETESNGLACQLVFTYTEKYPDTEPSVEIENPINFEDDFEENLLAHIKETVRLWVSTIFYWKQQCICHWIGEKFSTYKLIDFQFIL